MEKACIYDIGNCFIFNVKVTKEMDYEYIRKQILINKASAIIFGDILYLPYDTGSLSVFLFRAYSRKAFDIYHKLQGTDMRSLDPFAVQRILYSIGVTSCKQPCIYEFQPIQVIRKE